MDEMRRNREVMSYTTDEIGKGDLVHAEVPTPMPMPGLASMVFDVDLALSVALRIESSEEKSQVLVETSLEVLAYLRNGLASRSVLNRLRLSAPSALSPHWIEMN